MVRKDEKKKKGSFDFGNTLKDGEETRLEEEKKM